MIDKTGRRCDVCFYQNTDLNLWIERSRFGEWNVDRCQHCHEWDAHPLADLEDLIYGEDGWVPTWLLYEQTYVQSPRSKGGIYVSVKELTQ
jgi:hypothetical protein